MEELISWHLSILWLKSSTLINFNYVEGSAVQDKHPSRVLSVGLFNEKRLKNKLSEDCLDYLSNISTESSQALLQVRKE